MFTELEKYGYEYPELVWDIVCFFGDRTISTAFPNRNKAFNPDLNYKFVIDFCMNFKAKYADLGEKKEIGIQPKIVGKICSVLCENIE